MMINGNVIWIVKKTHTSGPQSAFFLQLIVSVHKTIAFFFFSRFTEAAAAAAARKLAN